MKSGPSVAMLPRDRNPSWDVKRDPSLSMVARDRHPSSGAWLTITPPPPGGSRMCGKQRACGREVLDVWQGKELGAHFADVWQGKELWDGKVESWQSRPGRDLR